MRANRSHVELGVYDRFGRTSLIVVVHARTRHKCRRHMMAEVQAILAGGRFRGVQELFHELPEVIRTHGRV